MIYDTLKLAKSLRDEAHFPADQAEVLAQALGRCRRGGHCDQERYPLVGAAG
jgi:hypothetical protein